MPITRSLAASVLALSLVLPGAAGAQVSDYPNRKITFMVGFAPGGGIDTFARVLAQGLTEQFGYPIVIENRPGAASNIAARAVANAAADGYTFLVTGNSLAINQTYYKNPGYTISELAPIAFSARDSMAIAVTAGNPARTLGEVHGGGQGEADQLRLRRIVGAHRQRICLQGAGEAAGDGGAVSERRAGAERAAWRPRRCRDRPDRGDLPAGAAGQAPRARGDRPETRAGTARRADLARSRARRDRGLWLERHPGAGEDPDRRSRSRSTPRSMRWWPRRASPSACARSATSRIRLPLADAPAFLRS